MVILSKIYTRGGDKGMTHLGDGTRVFKFDPRIMAMSAVDETNSSIGMLLSYGVDSDIRDTLFRIQNDLFDVGADLCTPLIGGEGKLRVTPAQIKYLEDKIDHYNESLTTLKSFVLPAGHPAAAQAHMCRTISRRAELAIWHAIDEYETNISYKTAQYMNRLSDLLFVLARYMNNGNDTLWIPGENR